MTNEIHWVTSAWPGKLALAARPRGGDWLHQEMENWRRNGINTVVSLLTADEASELGLENEARAAQAEHMTFLSLPIRDRQVPGSDAKLSSTLRKMEDVLSAGKNVLVHCRQGIGRTGLVAACLMINRGWEPEAAIEMLSDVRGISVPETQEQRQWIEKYAAAKVGPHHLHAGPKR
jgi:protein-tyrosine phosphatase